jgi:hypothetical protein
MVLSGSGRITNGSKEKRAILYWLKQQFLLCDGEMKRGAARTSYKNCSLKNLQKLIKNYRFGWRL